MKDKKVIILLLNGEESRFPLESERVLIGRDESCDIVIHDDSVSRKHAAISHKFNAIYIENVSSTGRITKNGEDVEYIQIEEGEEIGIGAAVLYWRVQNQASVVASAPTPMPQGEESTAHVSTDGNPVRDHAEFSLERPAGSNAQSQPDNFAVAATPEANPISGDFEIISSEKTTVQADSLHPVLKVLKGEMTTREIKLDFGSSWTVGRTPQCEVFIDNQKLSRQHFKILKVGNTYRVEDLGSANGTRLNGVTIKDAPLHPFDTIQAGPVEIQFIIVDADKFTPGSNLLDNALPIGIAVDHGFSGGASANEHTQFLAPEVIAKNSARSGGGFTNPFANVGSFQSGTGASTHSSLTTEPKASLVSRFGALPKERKILYSSLALFLILAGALGLVPSQPKSNESAVAQQAPVAKTTRTPANLAPEDNNGADPKEISPEFALLSTDKQNEIRALYVKAEQAKQDRNWKGAYDSSKAILNLVKRYKKATDILDEAQSYLNEEQIGILSKSLSNVADAAMDNKERVQLLVENGEKALQESRWDDAKESFSKAMNLDPTNDKATQGFAAAHAKSRNVTVKAPTELPQVTADSVAGEEEKDELDAFKKRYQDARSRFNSGAYREAIPIFRDIDQQIAAKLEDYAGTDRAPASIQKNVTAELKTLQSRVREGIESGRAQLRAEYQTQLADADQFINNRQYIEARETYDRILRLEPTFDDALEGREKLYSKIITEAKTLYQESLIYESVSDLDSAAEGYKKTKDLLTNVNHPLAIDYYKKSLFKLRRLQK